jgi:hypothetical protein
MKKKLLIGKVEIVYLLTKAIAKFEKENGVSIVKNSNRKNYEQLAKILSEISNQLPYTNDSLVHEIYTIDYNAKNQEYPFRKYDITGNQIKDAYYNQIVSNPRPFLIDACYIYLYGVGRKGFELSPLDEHLLEPIEHPTAHIVNLPVSLHSQRQKTMLLSSACFVLLCSIIVISYQWIQAKKEFSTLKKELNLFPYQPTKTEVDSLEGVWLCYTGSPQARTSDPNRYHMVVYNVVEIKHKGDYFSINRYGANFDQVGYAKFESPWLVSLHMRVKNNDSTVLSPRYSLMQLDKEKKYISVISTSWNFDIGKKNKVVGIREVYVKMGKDGKMEEVMNTIENAICKCKIVKWEKNNREVKIFQLKNHSLDELPDNNIKALINENSILMRVPSDSLIIRKKFNSSHHK